MTLLYDPLPNLKLIDCHVHCLPTYQEAKDYAAWAKQPETAPLATLDQLMQSRSGSGIVKTNIVMLTPSGLYYQNPLDAIPKDAPNRPSREKVVLTKYFEAMEAHNSWGDSLVRARDEATYYCGVDVARMPETQMLESLDRHIAAGATGVKISPPNMRLFGDDPRLLPLFDYCQSRDLPVLSAAGNPRHNADLIWDHVPPFAKPLKRFPKLRIIFAHMGHFKHMPDGGASELAETIAGYENACTDLSLLLESVALGERDPKALVSLIRKVGVSRVLFGTNYPFGDVKLALQGFWRLPLADHELDLIASKNYMRLNTKEIGTRSRQ